MTNDENLRKLHEGVVLAKRKIKDSVFTNLFSHKEYLMELYHTLHPEDSTITEEQLTDVTIRYIFTDGIYNDLGFKVANRLIILVEAQSTWSPNIVIRSLMYLVVTYQKFISETEQNIYSQNRIFLPKPELYVIYTGDQKRDEYISLSQEYFQGDCEFLETKVKVFYKPDQDNIIGQYITFSKVYDEQRRKYGRTVTAVRETINICKNRNVLKKYLEEHEKEVESMMVDFEDVEAIERHYEETVVKKRIQEKVDRQVKEIIDQVKEQVDRQVKEQVDRQVKEQVDRQVKEQVDRQVKEQVDRQVKEQVDRQVKEQVDNQVKEQMKANIIRMLKNPEFTVELIAQCLDVPEEEVCKVKKEMNK